MKNIFKNMLFTIAASGIMINSNAQNITLANNFMVGVTGGISTPMGNFAKTDYDNNASGFAGAGYNLGITGTYFLTRHFGINALVSYSQYSFKGIQHIADGFHESFDVDSSSATTKGSDHSISILVGPYYTVPLSAKLSVHFRLLAGITSSTLAGWDVVLTDAGITHPPLTQNTSSATAFGLQGGIGLHYTIARHWGVMLNGDYFYSKPNFAIENLDRNANAGREISSYNQPLAGINVNITLLYELHL